MSVTLYNIISFLNLDRGNLGVIQSCTSKPLHDGLIALSIGPSNHKLL